MEHTPKEDKEAREYCTKNKLPYFDYLLQCWVDNEIIQRCGHPEDMKCSCYGRKHAGENIYLQKARS